MSREDVTSLRRRRLLARLGHLFARIDHAFSRGDFNEARARNQEVGELLKELVLDRADPMRSSGVQSGMTEDVAPNSSRRAS
jgi:hypothetical protein